MASPSDTGTSDALIVAKNILSAASSIIHLLNLKNEILYFL